MVDLSSVVKVTFEMDRSELDMGQDPCVEILEIDTDDLEEAIEGDCGESHRLVRPTNSSNCMNLFAPSASILSMTEAQKAMDPVRVAMSSMTALQASMKQLKTPEVVKAMQQMSAISAPWAETVKSIQRMQENLPVNVFAPMTDIIARMGQDKTK